MKEILEISSLFLCIINGICLFYLFNRDRAHFKVKPVHPQVYQWWFQLPPSDYKGHPTRKFGFITYLDISNSGLRNAALDRWRLKLTLVNHSKVELIAMNMPEGEFVTEGFKKRIPVLGQKGVDFGGNLMVQAGNSISGMSYYIYECYGDVSWNPLIVNNNITARIEVENVFEQKVHTNISFTKKDLEWIKDMFPNILDCHNNAQQIAQLENGDVTHPES